MRGAFNIRVYGILTHNRKVLVSDERRFGLTFTKFPGGGLEFGEGLIDCLKREFLEELGVTIDVHELIYLTDFAQISAFDPNSQVISIYYRVSTLEPERLPIKLIPFDFAGDEQEVHRWIPIDEVYEDQFYFPIDKIVAEMLRCC
jgi:8-oxo-dGTP diphosphatase